MASSSSSSSGVPPGFRFHPTDEELLLYYLRKKVSFERFDLEVIKEVDLNKMEPWDLQERCRIGSAPQNEWYFFSHKDRKYPTGSRTNRATNAGFWKATGRDKCIRNSYKKIGMRKTLVFYRGRAPHGQKTDWIMHEYRLEEGDPEAQGTAAANEDGWVVCRVFKKKHFFKIGGCSMGGEASNASQGMESHMPFIGIDPSRTHYLHQDQQNYTDHSSNLYRSDLALHYTPPQHYSPQVQVQDLLPDHRAPPPPPSYDFSVLPGEPSTIARQYQVCEPGMDIGGGSSSSCEPMPHVVGGRDPNDWTMLVATSRLGQDTTQMTTDAAMNQVNQMSNPRGEMDLWGYMVNRKSPSH